MVKPSGKRVQRQEKSLYSIEQLSRHVHGKVIGDPSRKISGFGPAREAKEDEITFLAFPKYLPDIMASRAGAVIVSSPLELSGKSQIVVPNPYLAFIRIIDLFHKPTHPPEGISPLASVSPASVIGRSCSISPFVFVDEGAEIGDHVILYPGVFVGKGVKIGSGSLIYPKVVLYDGTRIGQNAIIHGGTVIGSDGFGFVTEADTHYKVPQLGIVVIEDDVELGANVTIDRATFGETRIKKGTKTDNQVHVGHNVVIGEKGLIAGQVGFAGSSVIGDLVSMGGQVGVAGHLKIGNRVTIAGKGGVTHDLESNQTVAGFPAVPHRQWKKSMILIGRLEEMADRIKEMGKKIEELELQLKKQTEGG